MGGELAKDGCPTAFHFWQAWFVLRETIAKQHSVLIQHHKKGILTGWLLIRRQKWMLKRWQLIMNSGYRTDCIDTDCRLCFKSVYMFWASMLSSVYSVICKMSCSTHTYSYLSFWQTTNVKDARRRWFEIVGLWLLIFEEVMLRVKERGAALVL